MSNRGTIRVHPKVIRARSDTAVTAAETTPPLPASYVDCERCDWLKYGMGGPEFTATSATIQIWISPNNDGTKGELLFDSGSLTANEVRDVSIRNSKSCAMVVSAVAGGDVFPWANAG